MLISTLRAVHRSKVLWGPRASASPCCPLKQPACLPSLPSFLPRSREAPEVQSISFLPSFDLHSVPFNANYLSSYATAQSRPPSKTVMATHPHFCPPSSPPLPALWILVCSTGRRGRISPRVPSIAQLLPLQATQHPKRQPPAALGAEGSEPTSLV